MKDYTNQLKEISEQQFSLFYLFEEKIQGLTNKYSNTDKIKVSNISSLKVGDISFTYSFVFDDISFNEGNNFVMNMFFFNLEKIEGNYDKNYLKRIFPSFFKISDFLEKNYLNGPQIVLSENFIDEDGDFTIFTDFSKLKNYMESFNIIFSLLDDFVNEVDNYLNDLTFIFVSYSKPVSVHSNGGVKQDILFKSSSNLYQIKILSESHEQQSYAKLFIKDNNGWTCLKHFNPKRDFNIDLSYKTNFKENVFSPIIRELKEIAHSVDKVC